MKYDIIYADPPWTYDSTTKAGKINVGSRKQYGAKGQDTGSATDHYPTMTKQDLENMDIEGLAAKDCLLFMWVTGPHLDQGIELGRKWGFDYKQVAFAWDKQRVNPGSYTMTSVELCLVFKRKKGKIPTPRGARNVRQFVSSLRQKHSQKPDEVRYRIDAMFPEQRKIELFARRPIDDPLWDVWGNDEKVQEEKIEFSTDSPEQTRARAEEIANRHESAFRNLRDVDNPIKSLFGQWPGDESDEEFEAALKETK